jgi:hypothetical protein
MQPQRGTVHTQPKAGTLRIIFFTFPLCLIGAIETFMPGLLEGLLIIPRPVLKL